jgi:hypothetical protein
LTGRQLRSKCREGAIERLLRHADLTHSLGDRRALSLQNFNLTKLRYNLFSLLSFSSHR